MFEVCVFHRFKGCFCELIENNRNVPFLPTAFKGGRGIVFTHGVRVGGRREIVCLGCISETIRCRKLILGSDIG